MGKKARGSKKKQVTKVKSPTATSKSSKASKAAAVDDWALLEEAIRENQELKAKQDEAYLRDLDAAVDMMDDELGEVTKTSAAAIQADKAMNRGMSSDLIRRRLKLQRRRLPAIPKPGEFFVTIEDNEVDVGEQLKMIPRHMAKERRERWAFFYDVKHKGMMAAMDMHPWVDRAMSSMSKASDEKIMDVAARASKVMGLGKDQESSDDATSMLQDGLTTLRAEATSDTPTVRKPGQTRAGALLTRVAAEEEGEGEEAAVAPKPAADAWDTVDSTAQTAPSVEDAMERDDEWE